MLTPNTPVPAASTRSRSEKPSAMAVFDTKRLVTPRSPPTRTLPRSTASPETAATAGRYTVPLTSMVFEPSARSARFDPTCPTDSILSPTFACFTPAVSSLLAHWIALV